jgi:hypothetical protein
MHTTKDNTHRFVISSSAPEFRPRDLIATPLMNPELFLLEIVTAVVEVETIRVWRIPMNCDTTTCVTQ